jgi:hypothetical protein
MVCNSQSGNCTSVGARCSGDKAQDKGGRPMLYRSIYGYSCLIVGGRAVSTPQGEIPMADPIGKSAASGLL